MKAKLSPPDDWFKKARRRRAGVRVSRHPAPSIEMFREALAALEAAGAPPSANCYVEYFGSDLEVVALWDEQITPQVLADELAAMITPAPQEAAAS